MNIGAMKDRIHLQERGATQWDIRDTVWAEITYLRGTESVIEGRKAGRNTVVIRVRRSAISMAATSAWRLKNAATNEVYDIKSRIPGPDFIDFTCETG